MRYDINIQSYSLWAGAKHVKTRTRVFHVSTKGGVNPIDFLLRSKVLMLIAARGESSKRPCIYKNGIQWYRWVSYLSPRVCFAPRPRVMSPVLKRFEKQLARFPISRRTKAAWMMRCGRSYLLERHNIRTWEPMHSRRSFTFCGRN